MAASKRRNGERGRDKARRVISQVRRKALEETRAAVTVNRGGQPAIAIDWGRVENLLALGCTDGEVASGLGISRSTLVENGSNRDRFSDIKSRVQERESLSLRQTLLGFVHGFRVPLLDEHGAPVLDSHGDPRMITQMSSERVRFEAAKFLSKQPSYLGFSERTDFTSKGERILATPTGIVSILIDDGDAVEEE